MILEASLRRMTGETLNLIHEVIEVDEFIFGGSWVSMRMHNAFDLMFED